MQIQLNFRSGIPIYLQLIAQIKQLISSGALHPGDQLPTVRQLAADLRVNFNTIARAYRMLDEEGIISTQHGRGTYILEPDSVREQEDVRLKSLEIITRHYLAEAMHLGFNHEEIRDMLEQFIVSLDDDVK